MREIKFRGYDPDTKRWKVFTLKWLMKGPYNICAKSGKPFKWVCESTGLHDKNGKEIWEGDILAHTSWVQNKVNGSPQDDFSDNQVIEGVLLRLNKNPYPIHRDFIRNPYRIVEYVDSDEFYQATGFFSPFIGSCKPKEFEVLGNIYENPELIEKGMKK